MSRAIALFVFVVLTLATQVGGLILILAWLIGRYAFPVSLCGWRRIAALATLFAGLYTALSIFLVPPLAAVGGRIPLPCRAESERPFAAAHPLYCVMNRHYVDPRLAMLLTALSREINRTHPGTLTVFLDASFPFLDRFPLLPHLSHGDGRKLDIAYYYGAPDGSYLPGQLRSPIGYWAFEQPGAATSPYQTQSWLSLRWDMKALQRFYPDRPLEPERTGAALRWLVTEGPQFGVERVFIEPYLATRLEVSSPILGFQGCRAARHDDHIHFQIRR